MHLHLTDTLQIHPSLIGQPPGAVTVLGPRHAVEACLTFEAGIPRCPPSLDATEETVERLVESAQRGLLTGKRPHRLIRAYRPDLGQLRRLVAVADAGLAVRPPIPALLQRGVVQLTMRIHARRQRDMLPRGRTQPKHIRPPHEATASHSPSEHTPPGVRRNRRSDMLRTLQNRTDRTHDHTLVTSPDSPGG
jgi:hypothetical protein